MVYYNNIVEKKISDYILNQDSKQKEVLLSIRKVIKDMLSNAEEKMSYGVPSFKLDGKSILYAAFKNHVGIYPDPSIIEYFSDDLKEYETSKGKIKFDLEKPIPFDLIRKIVVHKYSL